MLIGRPAYPRRSCRKNLGPSSPSWLDARHARTVPCLLAKPTAARFNPGGNNASPAVPLIQQSMCRSPSSKVALHSTSNPHDRSAAAAAAREDTPFGRHRPHPANTAPIPSTSSGPRDPTMDDSAAAAFAAPIDPASDPQNLHPHFIESTFRLTTRARNSHSRLSTQPAPLPAASAMSTSLTVLDWIGGGTTRRHGPTVLTLGTSTVTLDPGVNLT